MAADTRDRMIDAALDALRTKGVAGMSFTDVLEGSGAARGAIYHHFPRGKEELVTEAAGKDGRAVCRELGRLPADHPLSVVRAFLAAVRPVVGASAGGAGCPTAAVAMDHGALRTVAAEIFASWTTVLTDRLRAAGVPDGDAADLATTLLTLLQGAHVLCRADGDLAPFDRTARTAVDLVRHRYGEPGEPSADR